MKVTYAVNPPAEPPSSRWPGPITLPPTGPGGHEPHPHGHAHDHAADPYGHDHQAAPYTFDPYAQHSYAQPVAYPPPQDPWAQPAYAADPTGLPYAEAPPEPYVWTYTPAKPPGPVSRFLTRLAMRSPRWIAPASILVCFAGAAAAVLIGNPTDRGANQVDTCLFKLTTGLDCPGCGGTRAFYYLLHGNIPEAARHHAVAVFAAPFLVWIYLAWAIERTTGKKIPSPRLSSKAVSIFLIVWGVFAVVRNLPWAPFTSLYV